ncbi:hypothetical protein MMC13_006788 [Lambiella insularis]|nr:hypothetical protein [Lambiella insularis]
MPALGGKMLVNMFGIGDVMERRRNREESQRAERYLRSPQGQTSPFARRRSNSVDNWQLSGPIRQGPSNPAWFRPQSALSRQQSRWVSSRPQSRDRNRGWETPPPLFTDQSPPPRRRRRLVSPYEEDVREGWSNGEFSAIPDMSDEEDEDEDEANTAGFVSAHGLILTDGIATIMTTRDAKAGPIGMKEMRE